MASQRPRRNNSPASSKLQPLKATVPISSLIRNPSPTRRGRQSPGSSPAPTGDSKSRVRRSPDVFSTEHRALVSPLGDKPKPKPMKLNLHSNIRRTTSLETLSSSYMNGQWPKDGIASSNKGTQTPQVWDDYCEEVNNQQQQKRSSSFGSADTKEKIRHYLQRSKQSQSIHTQSPVQGDHSAVATQHLVSTHSLSRAIPIPSSPKTPSLHTRRSVEGLNTEIETLVLSAVDEDEKQVFERTPEGHRAPIASLLTRNVDSHTQTANGIIDQSDLITSIPSGGTSRCQSESPSWPIPPGGIGDSRPSSRSSSSGQGVHETESPEANTQTAKFSSSPKPNNSFQFARGPPDGAERIPLHIDTRDVYDIDKKPDTILSKFCPDPTKGNIHFSKNSPFSPLPCQPQMKLGGINAGSQT